MSEASEETVRVRKALGQLSARFRRGSDPRQYGVNCAIRVMDDVLDGSDAETAIRKLLGQEVSDE